MKKIVSMALAILIAASFFSCKGQKDGHEHGPDTHIHGDKMALLGSTDYFGAYDMEDERYGTKTKVVLMEDVRIMTTNSLPNHKTGSFPNEGNPNSISVQDRRYSFPINPIYTGKAKWIREPGIALNGIKFEPGTGEVAVCETGERYPIEAMQDLIDLGLDYNHAHVQPTGAYHYHGTPTEVIKEFDTGADLVHVGFAHDGFAIYYSKTNAYKPSFTLIEGVREGEDCEYNRPGMEVVIADGGHHDGTFNSDYEYIAGSGDLDECNGINIDGQYMYLVTDDFPFVGRCLMGEFDSQEGGGGPPRDKAQGGGGRGEGNARNEGPPTVERVLEELDTNNDGKISKKEAKGPLSQKFEEVDMNEDGFISKNELQKDLSERNATKPGHKQSQ